MFSLSSPDLCFGAKTIKIFTDKLITCTRKSKMILKGWESQLASDSNLHSLCDIRACRCRWLLLKFPFENHKFCVHFSPFALFTWKSFFSFLVRFTSSHNSGSHSLLCEIRITLTHDNNFCGLARTLKSLITKAIRHWQHFRQTCIWSAINKQQDARACEIVQHDNRWIPFFVVFHALCVRSTSIGKQKHSAATMRGKKPFSPHHQLCYVLRRVDDQSQH